MPVTGETRPKQLFRLALASLLAAPWAAWPQQPSVPLTDSDGRLEEIVITAQKRSEDLQSVPISVQVISGQTLKEQNYNNLQDLTQTVPAVHISSGLSSNQLFIRGIGSGDISSFDQSVAIFDDDIYMGRSRLSGSTFLDLARIEVLKGPQSTYFGNSAIAGALNIVTQKPGATFDAEGRLLYGQWGQYAAEGEVGGPISDILGVRLAILRTGERGWIYDVNTGEQAPDENNEAGRLTIVFKPWENLEVTLKAEGSRADTTGTQDALPDQRINCPPAAPFTAAFVAGCPQALALGAAVPEGLSNDENTGLAGQYSYLATSAEVLTVNYRQWEHTFTSITGITQYNYNSAASTDLPVLYQEITDPESYHQVSQELRIASPTDQRIQYLVGAYFQRDRLISDIDGNLPYANYIATYPGFTGLAPYLPLNSQTPYNQLEHVYSVFGSLGWNVNDQIKLNAGLRALKDEKTDVGSDLYGTSSQVYGGYVPIPPAIVAIWQKATGQGVGTLPAVSNTFQALTPSAGIQYHVNSEAMLYFSYNKGYKPGGFNGQELVEHSDLAAYGPEHVNAYEAGIKSKWDNDRILVNADVFLSDYKDLQVNEPFYLAAYNAYQSAVRNAAASRSQGVELETQWAPVSAFRLSADVTYLESTYTSFPNSAPPTLQNFCANDYVLPTCGEFGKPVPATANVTGQSTPYAPKWSGSLSGSYTFILPGNYRFITKLDPYFTSSFYADGANGDDPVFRIGGYVRLDGTMTLEAPGGHWALDLIGKNLTDRVIVDAIALAYASKEEPTNFAIQIRGKF
jgi:iron complex outermembrane recepter protein